MTIKRLEELSTKVNIAEDLDETKLMEIAGQVMEGYTDDRQTMTDWLDEANQIMELTHLKGEKKNWPFENAANVKYPLITLAIIQFASRTLPEVIKSNKAVRYKLIGRDDGQGIKVRKGQRVTEFLNYKLLEESNTWIEERDRLFHQVAALGTVFTKTYFDPLKGKVESKLIPYDKIIVNNNITQLEDAPRISHLVEISDNDVLSGQRLGYFRKADLNMFKEGDSEPGWQDMPEFIEQHCWLDLDEDGFNEPYMVLMHPSSMQVLRIRANYLPQNIEANSEGEVTKITPQTFFSDYHFIPNPDGTFFSLGFGSLLRTTNETVNTVFNQLVDAGTLANMQGGFIGRGVRIRKRDLRLQPGEWVQAEGALGQSLKDQIVPLSYKEPSTVLFQLMEYLIGSAKELTSTTEALTGTAETQNTSPTTLMALIQQGLTVFTMIQKRMYRGLQKEFKKVYELYAQWTDIEEYQNVLDLPPLEMQEAFGQEGAIADFDLSSVDITPISDFNSATETERLIQSRGFDELVSVYGPRLDVDKIIINKLEALRVDNPESYLLPPQQGPSPDQIEMQMKAAEIQVKEQKNQIDAAKAQAQIEKDTSQAIKNLAEAEAAEAGPQLEMYKEELKSLVNIETARQNGQNRTGTSDELV